jgi:hypothetical protein
MHMRGTGIEKEVEIYATNITNKTKCMNASAKKWGKNCEDMSSPPFTRERKQIQFPKRRVFHSLEYRTMEKVQKPDNSVCYTASSEPFRIY